MARQLSMATRKELIAAVGSRYRASSRSERRQLLAEFVALTGYHRKHAIRVLAREPGPAPAARSHPRLDDEAVQQALIVLWEAADRLCGQRLKALIPTLLEALERHGHLHLEAQVRDRWLTISAATMDRLLGTIREPAGGVRRRRWGEATALRRRLPIRTLADGNDPPPGYLEVDLVAHSGGSVEGRFVHTLVLTDIASGGVRRVAAT
jgi:hypothetical protein